jgi:hypothetical protein
MKFDIRERLARGKLIAFGMREGASLKEGPIRVPRYLFPTDRQDQAIIDWDAGTLTTAGHRFFRIRVSVPSRRIRRQEKPKDPEAAHDASDDAEAGPEASKAETKQQEPEPVKRRGRPRVDEPLRAVVRSLHAGTRFDCSAFRQRVDLLIHHYAPGRFTEPLGGASELPVFIVGMPRSGTTLTEQIAASHSRIFGAGELPDIGWIADTLAGGGKREVAARRADADLASRLGHRHLLRLRELGGEAVRVIDKMPDNVLHLGLIAQLYPGARVIFCTRDARDISISCYFQLFAEGLHPFSYDLADCGRRTAEVNRLISHWRQALPLRWHEVNYEAMVRDLEGESRRLIAFLGLQWEPGCLEFHRTERTVTTISHWQVRQPIYTRSVGRWRHYRKHLQPLFEVLGCDSPLD